MFMVYTTVPTSLFNLKCEYLSNNTNHATTFLFQHKEKRHEEIYKPEQNFYISMNHKV